MSRTPRTEREFDDELELLIREQQNRDRGIFARRSGDAVLRGWWENAKIILPWLVAIGMFLWNANSSRITDLEKKLKEDYVTKDSFQPVADGVKEIRAILLEDRRRSREREEPK